MTNISWKGIIHGSRSITHPVVVEVNVNDLLRLPLHILDHHPKPRDLPRMGGDRT